MHWCNLPGLETVCSYPAVSDLDNWDGLLNKLKMPNQAASCCHTKGLFSQVAHFSLQESHGQFFFQFPKPIQHLSSRKPPHVTMKHLVTAIHVNCSQCSDGAPTTRTWYGDSWRTKLHTGSVRYGKNTLGTGRVGLQYKNQSLYIWMN